MQRNVRIGDWDFEVTQVRARKVKKYGAPFTSIATIDFKGNVEHLEGLLSRKEENFSKQDFQTHVDFAQKMQCDTIKYTRYHQGKSREKILKI
jgi:hypothetical protein